MKLIQKKVTTLVPQSVEMTESEFAEEFIRSAGQTIYFDLDGYRVELSIEYDKVVHNKQKGTITFSYNPDVGYHFDDMFQKIKD